MLVYRYTISWDANGLPQGNCIALLMWILYFRSLYAFQTVLEIIQCCQNLWHASLFLSWSIQRICRRCTFQHSTEPPLSTNDTLKVVGLVKFSFSLILVLLKFQFRLHSLLSNSFDYVFVEGDTKIAPCVIHACSFWGYSHNHIIILVVLSLCWTYSGGFSAKVWGHWSLLHTFAQASEKERHALSVAGEPLLSSFQHGQ